MKKAGIGCLIGGIALFLALSPVFTVKIYGAVITKEGKTPLGVAKKIASQAAVSKEVESPEAAAKEVKSQVPSTKDYRYERVGKNDPFKPFVELDPAVRKAMAAAAAAAAAKKAKESSLPISPLQRLEITAIKVVGIAGEGAQRKAIVEDRQRKFYPVRVGMYIGRNNGVIKEILADRIIVEEKSKDSGKTAVNLVTMMLHTN